MRIFLLLAAVVLQAFPAVAAVKGTTPFGFEVVQAVTIAATPVEVFKSLGHIETWWDPAHTYSGDARNLSLKLQAGGCFCEKLKDGGSVEHMTVVLVVPGETLRLRGAMGPLQGEGMDGALTFTLKPAGSETDVTLRYAAGGYLPAGTEKIAPAVDAVLGQQLTRLKQRVESGK